VPAERGRGGTPPLDADPQTVASVCAAFQSAAIGTVELKLRRALDAHPRTRTIIVGGGVSANSLLRERLAALAAERGLGLSLPAMEFCLDNGAMIAALGHATLTTPTPNSPDLAHEAEPWAWSPADAALGASPASLD
jgi:N6-L-threonylcarbamoyladenine synthase